MYYKYHHDSSDALTAGEIRDALKSARIPNHKTLNISDALAKSNHFVDIAGSRGSRKLWLLTKSGEKYVRQLLDLPAKKSEIEEDVSSLGKIAQKIGNTLIKDYIDEGIKCLEIGARRASVVFIWAGAMRTLHEEMFAQDGARLNAALQKHDKRSRQVKSIDHFSYIKDEIALLAAQELGLLDKSQKDTLKDALGLRNRCGHPAKYKPGEKKVSSFIEDIIEIVFK